MVFTTGGRVSTKEIVFEKRQDRRKMAEQEEEMFFWVLGFR